MKFVYGKLFQDVESRKIRSLAYDINQNYYKLICEAKEKGLRQVIITSDIMLHVAEQLLLHHDCSITEVEFLVDDEELQNEINSFIRNQQNNICYWKMLMNQLKFICENDSIDIKRITYRNKQGIFFIQVNGIFSAPKDNYESFSEILVHTMEGCIQ